MSNLRGSLQTGAQLLHRKAEEFLRPASYTALEAPLRAALAGAEQHFEYVFENGMVFDCHIMPLPTTTHDPKRRALAVARDITEARHRENELRNTKTQLEAILTSITDGLMVLTSDRRLIFANQAAATMAGFAAVEEMLAADLDTLVAPFEMWDSEGNALSINDMPLLQLLQGLPVPPVTVRYRRRGESADLWSMVKTTPVEDDKGKISYLVVVIQDITALKNAEAAVRESEEKFRQIAENIAEVFYVRSHPESRLLYISPAYNKMWGLSHLELSDSPFAFIHSIHPADLPKVADALSRQLEHGEMIDVEYRIMKPDFSLHWIRDRTFPIYNDKGELYRVVGIAEDITDFKLAETHAAELALERERSTILTRFVRDASHEFRTPLAIIQNNLYLLDKVTEPEKRQHLEQTIREKIRSTLKLLESMVILTELDSGLSFEFSRVEVEGLLQSVIADHRAVLDAKNITLVLVCPANLPLLIVDEKHLCYALGELVDNAIRYTPQQGQIVLQAGMEGGYDASKITFSLTDSGIGIAPDAAQRIFERFYRVDEAHSTQGFGLGLPIARRIIEKHGGDIQINSAPGAGTTVIVNLPLATGVDTPLMQDDPPQF